MKVVIAGSRSITDIAVVEDAIQRCGWTITTVICGCARGVDRLGEQWAEIRGLRVKHFPPKRGPGVQDAEKLRNEQMVKFADAVLVIWDGKSPGTSDLIGRTVMAHKPLYIATS